VTLAPPIAVVAVMRRGPLGDPVINVIYHIVRAYTLIWHHLRWEHKHRVPSVGGAILAPNHTTGIDGLVVQSALTRLVRWVMLSSYRFSSLEFMWKRADPVTLDDDTDNRTRVREVVRALRDGKLVGMYPEGSLQREVRELKPLKGGVILVAKRSGCPIIPTWIEGTPKVHAMLWHFVFPSRTRVYFGEPYHVDPDQTAEQALEELRRRLLALETEARSKG